ncbi:MULTISPECIES: cell division protein FtsQ/DivIB [unclassified Brevundimonas]|uniref:cell division protein FtsQ/DivIB n=1 Tax=unclassified Brevundimonas TaxID=2622653 RepID=UPI0006F42FAB|nr:MULTISPECIES: cell division protein FtsQ/DivIB [unclassified Brevundimonas]KQY93741.1 cell division protein FtsQ [Brevundimonas sp. Root1423]KRA29035.1 cell division protein FtsQ [Brevundimonas sp. Root608]
MPAVVRGGRRQSSNQPAKRGAAPRSPGRGRSPRNAPATPGKMAALGRLDLSPRAVIISIVAGVVVLAGVLATGARAERISASIGQGVDGAAAGMGLKLEKVFIEGESPEATATIQRAVQLYADQPMTSIDLDAVRKRVETVGWVKGARVVRLLPNTLIVHVVEHDRLAVWQAGGRNRVIDSHGVVIAGADAGRYPDLPLVVGKGAEQAASEVLPLIAQRPGLKARVEALVRVDERRWDLRLKDGSLIQLPATDQDAALIQLDALDQRERLLELGFDRIDLRTPGEVAVRPSAGAA